MKIRILAIVVALTIAGPAQAQGFQGSRIMLSNGVVGPEDMVVEEYFRRVNEETLMAGTCQWTEVWTGEAFRCQGIMDSFDGNDVFISLLYRFSYNENFNMSELTIINEVANEEVTPPQVQTDLLGIYWPTESLAQERERAARRESEEELWAQLRERILSTYHEVWDYIDTLEEVCLQSIKTNVEIAEEHISWESTLHRQMHEIEFYAMRDISELSELGVLEFFARGSLYEFKAEIEVEDLAEYSFPIDLSLMKNQLLVGAESCGDLEIYRQRRTERYNEVVVQ